MHIRADIFSCCDDKNDLKAEWTSSFRNIQTLLVAITNLPKPSIKKLASFYSSNDSIYKNETIEPSEISTLLLCEYGIFTKNSLLVMYPGSWVGDRTCKDMYSDSTFNYMQFLSMLAETRYPVIIHSGGKSYIIIDIIKSKYTASLLIGDPLVKCKTKRKFWVSANDFLTVNNAWMCLFIDE